MAKGYRCHLHGPSGGPKGKKKGKKKGAEKKAPKNGGKTSEPTSDCPGGKSTKHGEGGKFVSGEGECK